MGPCRNWYHVVRAIRAAALGAVIAMVMTLAVIHNSQLYIEHMCQNECNLLAWSSLHPEVDDLLDHIRAEYIYPEQDQVEHPLTTEDVMTPSWAYMGSWLEVMTAINKTFSATYEMIFVEVGASDGVLMSFTAWLEHQRRWKGLLIEPHPQSFEALRKSRKAAAVKACASPEVASKELLWSPREESELPELFRKVARARTTLKEFVSEEDWEAGTFTPVQCFSIPWLLKAWDPTVKTIHLLVLHTMGGEANILELLPDSMNILMLVIRYNTLVDRERIKYLTKERNMVPHKLLSQSPNFLLFINSKVAFKPF